MVCAVAPSMLASSSQSVGCVSNTTTCVSHCAQHWDVCPTPGRLSNTVPNTRKRCVQHACPDETVAPSMSASSSQSVCATAIPAQGSGFRGQGFAVRVQGSGFRVQGSGFRVQIVKGRTCASGGFAALVPAGVVNRSCEHGRHVLLVLFCWSALQARME